MLQNLVEKDLPWKLESIFPKISIQRVIYMNIRSLIVHIALKNED